MSNNFSQDKSVNSFINPVDRITAMWAFSEAAFGGILHALKIPFTGLFVGGAAVIFISLIALYSNKSTTILRSTLLVVLIKFIISPYTPINAYFSVFAEAILGVILFVVIKHYSFAALLLGVGSLLFSAFQKIFVITILFGYTIWQSIDIFSNYVINIFISTENVSIAFSYFLIGLYIFIHLTGGIIAGITAGRIPKWINDFSGEIEYDKIIPTDEIKKKEGKRKRKPWFQKKSGIFLIVMAIILVALSYLGNGSETNLPLNILIMFIRSIIITLLWFVFISPIATKFLQKFLNNKKSTYSGDVENILNLLPEMKAIVKYSWEKSNIKNGLSRLKLFTSYLFVIILGKG